MVGASLSIGNCVACTPGTTLTETLELKINNTTGSTRTAFAFWATLVITKPDGTVTTQTINGCNDSGFPGNTIKGFESVPITFVCGSTVKLTNVFLAWTDAANIDKNKCPAILADPNGISPKCGKAAEILVTTPPSPPLLTDVDPGCGQTTGSITIANTTGLLYSVNGGSFAPYPSGSYTNLAPGVYSIVAKNADDCVSAPSSVTIDAAPATPGKPTLSAVQPTCIVTTGQITITSSTSGLQFSLDGGAYAPYPAGGYTVDGGDHTIRAKNGDGCVSELATIKINDQPPPPVAEAGSPFTKTCDDNVNGKQIGEAPVAGFSYSWSSSPSGFASSAANPTVNPSVTTTYTVTKTNNETGCSDTDQVTVTVNTTKPTAIAGSDFTKTCDDNVNGGQIG
ncbi:MAG TPA: hypothetical protein VF646_14480, partial [Cytophagales bacterium]